MSDDIDLGHGISAAISVAIQRQNSRLSRSDRETCCRLVALGVALGSPAVLDGIDLASFAGSPIGAAIEACRRLKASPDDTTAGITLASFLARYLGVERADGERVAAAIIRTCEENAERARFADKVRLLAKQADNYGMSDAQFVAAVKALAAE